MPGGVEVTGATVEAADPKVSEMPEGKWHTGCWVHRAELPGALWATGSYVAICTAAGNVQEDPGREYRYGRKRTLDPVRKSPTFRGQWRRSQQRDVASEA